MKDECKEMGCEWVIWDGWSIYAIVSEALDQLEELYPNEHFNLHWTNNYVNHDWYKVTMDRGNHYTIADLIPFILKAKELIKRASEEYKLKHNLN